MIAPTQPLAPSDTKLPDLVGRDDVLAELDAALRRTEPGASAVELRGDAGIGKSTLLQEAIRIGVEGGAHLLQARPAFDERDLPYAGLGDLLSTVPAEAMASLPTPQRLALDVALLRTAPTQESGDWRAVAEGLLGTLRAMTATAPVLIAIDDEPWLDRSTARALSFALRRLGQEPITLLTARRPSPEPGAERVGNDLPRRVVEVGPMDVDELGRVIRRHLGAALPIPALTRLHAATGGNPFYAIQIAEAWQRSGTPGGEGSMPLPDRLRDVVRSRLAGLSDEALEVLLVASATARPDLELLEQVVGDADRVRRGVEEAEAAGTVALNGQGIRFTHPLLASGTYAGASMPKRRQLHRRLAEVVRDPEEHARHLALGTIRPDPAAADAIELGAQRAAARGAPDAAATLYEEAARLTLPNAQDEARRRLLAAADAHLSAGDNPRAQALLEQVVERSPAGEPRADALSRLADVLTRSHGVELAVDAWNRALDDAPAGSVLAGNVHDNLAWYVCWLGDSTGAHRHALEAQRIADEANDEPLRFRALTKVAMLEFQLGRGVNRPVLERAAAMERATGRGTLEAEGVLVLHLYWSDELREARQRALAILAEAREQGDVAREIDGLYSLIGIEYDLGDWDAAERHADMVAEKAIHAGADFLVARIGAWQALIAASRGRLDEARRLVTDALAVVRREKHRWMELRCLGTLGFIELAADDPHRAREYGLEAADLARSIDLPEPGIFHVVPDAIEALIATGELDTATERLDELQRQADATDRRWARAAASRCRGLLLAARGEMDASIAALDASVSGFRELSYPFELGRSLLAAGAAHRRMRHKQHARELLNEAAAIFDRLGAPGWQDRAGAELARIDGRAPASAEGLTQTERQVAELVAAGHSNREVADRLFVSVRTVESNLTRIYHKLDVRSRTQLARVIG